VAKLYAHWITVNYREAYGVFACNGIFFNHESPIRGETFVTRKVTRALAQIVVGTQQCLHVGNLNARRDWGHARDYVEAMRLILQQERPEDFVIATGEQRSVREFITAAGEALGVGIVWSGEGTDEVGVVDRIEQAVSVDVGQTIVRIDPVYYRPAEVDALVGDAGRARVKLKWAPKVSFSDLVAEMTKADLTLAKRLAAARGHSLKVHRPDLDRS
jgi:GDPmannose 4,6-dehydratase